MSHRRTLSVIALVSMASCGPLRPVNPNAGREPRPAPPVEIQAADTAVAPTPTPSPTSTPAPTVTAAPVTPSADAAVHQERQLSLRSVNDANIAAMLLASNNTDISYARLVPAHAERADVKAFAQRMLTDHIGVNGLLTQLLAKLDLAPEDNVASLDLRDESAAKRDIMRELNGYAFDSTYMENEVSYHRRFLYSIDNILSPRARNDELKTLLVRMRPAIAAHLAHAEQVRADVLTKK